MYGIIKQSNGGIEVKSTPGEGTTFIIYLPLVEHEIPELPEMNGRDLAAKMHEDKPDLKILFMSGYTGEEMRNRGVLEPGTNFIQKPFTPNSLVEKVREVLGS